MKNLKLLRKKSGLSQRDFAEIIHASQNTVSQWESGKREPSYAIAKEIANYFNVSVDYLLGVESKNEHTSQELLSKYPELIPVETKKIPLLGEIACGKPIFTNEEYEVFVDAATDIQADFALKACGDSMINARINDGDIVFIREQPDVNNGEIAAVAIDDEVTLKRVYRQENSITLVAENPVYAPLVYTQQSAVTIHILGKAVAFQSSL